MVSLSEDAHRTRGHFYDEPRDEEESLTDSATLSLVASTEQRGQTINTTWLILLEIVLLLCVWVAAFVLPGVCDTHSCGMSPYTLIVYIVGGVWFVQVLVDRYYRNQHYHSRLCGYLSFYRKTRNIRRLPLLIASTANTVLLIVTQVLMDKFPPPAHASNTRWQCGKLSCDNYLQIIVSVSCATQILLLVIYIIRTINFNKSGAFPDVNQEEMVTSFLQTNSYSNDIGFRDENYMDEVLERQADMIRYLKHHNTLLSKRVLNLTEENQALKQGH